MNSIILFHPWLNFLFLLRLSALNSSVDAFSASMVDMSNSFSSLTKNDRMQDYISRAEQQHTSEFEKGEQCFGIGNSSESSNAKIWVDDDFLSYRVEAGNAGPSENILNNGQFIFETKDPIIDDDECDYFIQMAKEAMTQERMSEEEKAKTENVSEIEGENKKDWHRMHYEIGEARISSLQTEALDKLGSLLQERLYHMLLDRFGLEDLTVYDGLILGNIAPSQSQPVHRDASILTLNIALSDPDHYQGGGTYIEGLEDHNGLPLRIGRGKSLCHSSGIMHAGTAITSGERWVMVLFVIAKNESEIARRTHASGLDLLHSNQVNEADIAFDAGQSVAPKDHVLEMGKWEVAMARGKEEEAFSCLTRAASYYPPSHKAAMNCGKILEAHRKPRAALRRFDQVLSYIDDKDLLDDAWMPLKALAWDARVSAGRCALLCAEQESLMIKWSERERKFTKAHLPRAISRFRTALIAAPGDGYILSMLERAKELLQDANEFQGS